MFINNYYKNIIMTIPKIIHQIWIGPKPIPINMIKTWKDKHPDFEHILWNKEEIKKRNMEFKCQKRIDEMEEWCGKADIMRIEILYKYGGIYIDTDFECLGKIPNSLLKYDFVFLGVLDGKIQQLGFKPLSFHFKSIKNSFN